MALCSILSAVALTASSQTDIPGSVNMLVVQLLGVRIFRKVLKSVSSLLLLPADTEGPSRLPQILVWCAFGLFQILLKPVWESGMLLGSPRY